MDVPLPVDLGTETEGDIPSSQCPPESCSHGKRDGSILMQQDARDELKVISQSSGAPLSELPGYAYDARGGRGITVYVVDTGINTNHIVSLVNSSTVNKNSLVSRNSEICLEAYVGSIYQVNHRPKVTTLVMGLVLPQRS